MPISKHSDVQRSRRGLKPHKPPSFYKSPTGTLKLYIPALSLCPRSNSCTSALAWACRRCLCIAARCTGKLAPSAAWPGTLTAPGTAASARDTSPPPRGRSLRATRTNPWPFVYPRVGLAEPACFSFASHAVTPGSYQRTCSLMVAVGCKTLSSGASE